MTIAGAAQVPVQDGVEQAGLSEIARTANIFFEPSKTFADIHRKSRWWAPFLLICLIGYGFLFVVDQKIGFTAVSRNALQVRPADLQKIESLPPAQRSAAWEFVESITKTISFAFPAFFAAVILIGAGVLVAIFNLGMGAKLTYEKTVAILTYASLPGCLKSFAAIAVVWLARHSETFMIDNPIGTNPGYYLGFNGSSFIYSLLSAIDIFSVWTVLLTGIGIAVVGKVSHIKAILTVTACWIVLILLRAMWT